VIRQQPTTRTTVATSYNLFDPYHDKKSEAPATTTRTALYEDSAYGTKPDTTSRCPINLRTEAERRMTEYEEDANTVTKWNIGLSSRRQRNVEVEADEGLLECENFV